MLNEWHETTTGITLHLPLPSFLETTFQNLVFRDVTVKHSLFTASVPLPVLPARSDPGLVRCVSGAPARLIVCKTQARFQAKFKHGGQNEEERLTVIGEKTFKVCERTHIWVQYAKEARTSK